jgi:transposase
MSGKGVSIRKMKEILRLYYGAQLSMHQIATSLNLSVGVVHKHLSNLKSKGVTWPLSSDMTNDELLALAKNNASVKKETIDFNFIHSELKRKGVTLQLLWEEHQQSGLIDLSYSQLCRRYRNWKAKQPQSMCQTHKAGDKLFIDYSGMTFDIIDPLTHQIRSTQIFIGVLGASNYTYAEATWSQKLEDWIRSHIRMFDYFGGVPDLLVPDNLKSAVTKTCRYEPDINPTYAELVRHYNTAVLPARPYKPKDKSKAEAGVLLVQRWILARLRNETFIGLDELNQAIKKLLIELNNKPFKKLPGTRRSLFKEIDQPALNALPKMAFEYKHFKRAKVNIDYHFELLGHYYSVPNRYIGEHLDIWHNNYIVEVYLHGKQITSHIKSDVKGKHTTNQKHMPTAHLKQSQWSAERFLNWANSIGQNTRDVTHYLLSGRDHQEQAFRSCLGLLSLSKKYSNAQLELACAYAIENNIWSRKSIQSILKRELYVNTEITVIQSECILDHENIRGEHYYH